MNDTVGEVDRAEQRPACELFLWCFEPKFERRSLLAQIAQEHGLELIQDESLARIEFPFEETVCVLCDSEDRFTVSFRDAAGDYEQQSRAAHHVVKFIGESADHIVGNWHVKYDYGCRDSDNYLLNLDDDSKNESLRVVVTKYCKV